MSCEQEEDVARFDQELILAETITNDFVKTVFSSVGFKPNYVRERDPKPEKTMRLKKGNSHEF